MNFKLKSWNVFSWTAMRSGLLTLRGTYWRNGTGYNSNAITYDS